MTTTSARSFGARLRLEHAGLDEMLERLIRAFETNDHEVARAAFREFDELFSAHLAVEDELVLPAFAHVSAAQAAQLAAEHRALRAKIDELVIGSDLHVTTLPAIRKLAEQLRAHAQREDNVLHPWVEESLEHELENNDDERGTERFAQPSSRP